MSLNSCSDIRDMTDKSEMHNIHELTTDWLTEQDRLIESELYISRYYAESEAARPIWVFELDEDMIKARPDNYVNLLCQNSEQGRHFHHLKFPTEFLSVCRHLLAYDKHNKRYLLQLSAERDSLFREQNGIGSLDSGIFRVD